MGLLDLFAGRPVDRFAKRIVDEIRRQDPDWRGRYSKNELTITADGPRSGSYYLGRVHEDYLASPPDEQARIVSDIARSFLEPPTEIDLESARPRLRPVIKNLTHVLNEARALAGAANATRVTPLVGPLGVLVAVDSERSMTMVSPAMLSDWQVSFDAVLAMAMENLTAISSTPQFERWEQGFHVSKYGDFFDASRILLPALFEALPLKGAPVAIVVERGGIVVTGVEEPEALAAMAEFAEAAIDNSQRGIAYTPLILRDGRWGVFDFDPVAHPALERLRIKQQLWDAEVQKDALGEHFKATKAQRCITDLIVEDVEGVAKTFTQWRDEALIPRADVVLFPGPGGNGMTPPAWKDIEAATESLTLQAGFHPPLYVIEIASDDVLERLRGYPCPAGFEKFQADEGWVNVVRER